MNPDQLAEFEMIFGLNQVADDWTIGGLNVSTEPATFDGE